MHLDDIQLDNISLSDIEKLISDETNESSILDYKLELKVSKELDKKEFLADVSAFANSLGGYLIYGIAEEQGVPQGPIYGIQTEDIDAEIRKLDNIIRDGIEPRIIGINIQALKTEQNKFVIVIKIPRSLSAPHMVIFQNYSRFYARNSAGKYQMDVSEIRRSILKENGNKEQIDKFYNERLDKIRNKDIPINFSTEALFCIHILPVISFVQPNLNAVTENWNINKKFIPINSRGIHMRSNFEGCLYYDDIAQSYVQQYRNGVIEAVTAGMAIPAIKKIPGEIFEQEIFNSIIGYLEGLKLLGLTDSFWIRIGLLNAREYSIAVSGYIIHPDGIKKETIKLDRDEIILPEIFVDDFDKIEDQNKMLALIKPSFNRMWQSFGQKESHYFTVNVN